MNTRFEKEEEKKNTLKLCNLHFSGGVFSTHIPCNSSCNDVTVLVACVAYSTSELLDISTEVVRYSVLQSIHSSQTLKGYNSDLARHISA